MAQTRKLPGVDQDKPRIARVAMDLDTLEREGAPDPYVIKLGGHDYVFEDAMNLDWQVLIRAMEHPATFFALVLSADDAKVFLDTKIPLFKLRALMDGYRHHYGMVEPGEAGA